MSYHYNVVKNMWILKNNFYFRVLFLLQLYCCCEFRSEWLIKTKCSNTAVEKTLDKHGFELVSQAGENECIVRLSKSHITSEHGEITDWKNLLAEDCVESVEPRKRNKRVARSITIDDPYWNKMWYLNGNTNPDMGVLQAWENGYTGKNITIAIVDNGVDYNHTDIQPNYKQHLSFDVVNNKSDPYSTDDSEHGTECAGVALAAKNNNCIIGIAYNSKLAAIRLIGNKPIDATMKHDALFRQQIDIYSSNWVDSPEQFKEETNLVKSALEKGINQGRKGLGSIYVWGTDKDCNGDSFVHNVYTIGVGSVTRALKPKVYNACSAIMVSAYGDDSINKIWTTTGKNGCNQNNVSRTTLATPMVAGILALTLESNPNLTWRDIQHLIVNTSDLSSLQYGNTQTNGAGRQVSGYFGFGLINAEKLTNAAKVWKNVRPQRKCPQNVTRDGRTTTNNNFELSSDYKAHACENTTTEVLVLEHVQIYVKIEYTELNAVRLDVTSPSNTTSKLLTKESVKKQKGILEWTFLCIHFWGENPVGIWTLKMWIDNVRYYGKNAKLIKWNMTFYGTTNEDHYPKPKTTKKPTTTIAQPTSSLSSYRLDNVTNITNSLVSFHTDTNSIPGLSVKKIIGITVGSVVGGIVIILLFILLAYKRNANRRKIAQF